MVYISTNALNASMRSSILTSQNDLATAQKELSSGTYADLGITLGASSGQFMSISQQTSRLAAFTATNGLASTRLTATATALTSLQSAATTFFANLTTASTGGGSAAGLQETATGNLDAFAASLNTVVEGQAIFGGINTDGTPIASYTATSASKQAVDNAFQSAFGTSQTSAGAASITASQMSTFLSGAFADLFQPTSYATTWSTATDQTQSTEIAPGQTTATSVSANAAPLREIAQVYTMVREFTGSASTLSASAQQAVISSAMGAMTQAMSGLTTLQASVGVAQNAISTATTQITAQTSLLTSQTGSLHDVDVYALNTQISGLQTQLQASYELTSELKKLSLVNYFTT